MFRNRFGNWDISSLLGLMYDTPGDADLLISPDDDPDDKDDSEDDSKDDDNNSSDDDKEEKDKESSDNDDDDDDKDDDEKEEKDDKEESEEEDEDDENEDLELTSTVKDIKKDFPEFFKKFPDVKAAMFRDQRYGSLFGSPEEAEKSAGRIETLNNLEKDLFEDGNPVDLLKTLEKNGGKEQYEKVIHAILPHLLATNKDLHFDVISVPFKHILRAAYRDGKGKGKDGKDLPIAVAAQWIHQFMFDNTDVEERLPQESKKTDGKTDREKALEARLNQLNDREANEFHTSVDNSYITRMTNEIMPALEKDERLTPWMRTKVVEETLGKIKAQLERDPKFKRQMGLISEQAKKAGYTKDFKSRLVSTALARAKNLAPTVRKAVVAEVLGRKVKSEDKKEKVKLQSRDKDDRSDRNSDRNRNTNRNNPPPKAKSDLDILRGT